jgi:DNA modification methylase
LRSYQTEPLVFGGDRECEHAWEETRLIAQNGKGGHWQQANNGQGMQAGKLWTRFKGDVKTAKEATTYSTGALGFCAACGAWRGQLGLEPTPELYVTHIVEIFREVRRVVRADGTLWLNMGDCYATGAGRVGRRPGGGSQGEHWLRTGPVTQPNRLRLPGLKPKDLVGIPWRVAFALQADGWYLRSDIVWAKPNPLPESVLDRVTRSHEYVFLLSKSRRYFYDARAIAEPLADGSFRRLRQPTFDSQTGDSKDYGPASNRSARRALVNLRRRHSGNLQRKREPYRLSNVIPWEDRTGTRNARTVWAIPVQPFKGAHFATFPPELARRCILAGCPPSGVVLDPFIGSGTTAEVALQLGRRFIGIDLSADYVEMAKRQVEPLLGAHLTRATPRAA